jgi:hypothetical protein
MASCKFGLVLGDDITLRRGRPEDRIDLVLWSGSLVDPPRAPATRALGRRLAERHAGAEVIPYAWHLVTHGPSDGFHRRGSRRLAGAAERFGVLQDTAEVERAWQVSARVVATLSAKRAVVRTPPSLTPGELGRRRLAAFVERRKAEGIGVVWEPEGLWTAPQAGRLARRLGVVLLTPALEGGRAPVDTVPGAWLRVDCGAGGQRLTGRHKDALLRLLEGPAAPAAMLFAGPRGHVNLRALLRELGVGGNDPAS